MVWRVVLKPNEPCNFDHARTAFRITNAALADALDNQPVKVLLNVNNHGPTVLCTLQKNLINQAILNIIIRLGDCNISLSVEGQGIVHLLGNYINPNMDS